MIYVQVDVLPHAQWPDLVRRHVVADPAPGAEPVLEAFRIGVPRLLWVTEEACRRLEDDKHLRVSRLPPQASQQAAKVEVQRIEAELDAAKELVRSLTLALKQFRAQASVLETDTTPDRPSPVKAK